MFSLSYRYSKIDPELTLQLFLGEHTVAHGDKECPRS